MNQAEYVQYSSGNDKVKAFIKGAIAILPISVAVIPWGILTGSLAIESGLDPLQSQGLSAIIFAGAVQLAIMGMIQAGAGIASILVSVLFITSRHFLYSMVMRSQISSLPLRWRLSLGFLLTDELFAIANPGQHPKFDRWYALGGGLFFYLGWNIATLVGIIAGEQIDDLDSLGLDFAIAATFIALIIPMIKKGSLLLCVLTATVVSIISEYLHFQPSLLIAVPVAMLVGFLYARSFEGE
ncbi:AzlC family ABC transporter permease [uncultured Endozoicomonas sp.]|uniref:AzlC family ABC transporter permease n=1 Tax=uncultured Endozoicomonas sp. TaxID=432652 RepID=UPI0026036C84|nr:AzlC family ABC transporter permease [uncultured Endozoicomonas sp.]